MPDSRVQRLSERVWVYRHQWQRLEPAVGMVLGADGWVAVDGGNSPRHGRAVFEAMQALCARPVRHVIDTHRHFDHVFGNQAFDAPVIGSRRCRQRFLDNLAGDWAPDRALAWLRATIFAVNDQLCEADFAGLKLVPPALAFEGALTLSLGDLTLELFPLDGVHTDDGIGVWIPEEETLFLGDALYFQNTPEGDALALPALVERAGGLPAQRFVAGHERVIERATFDALRAHVRRLADAIRPDGAGADAVLAAHPLDERLARRSFFDAAYQRRWVAAAVRRRGDAPPA